MKNEALVRNVPKTRKAILVLHSESLDETESFKSISKITDMYNCCTTKPTPRSVHKATHTSCKIHPFWDNIRNIVTKFLQNFHDKSFDLGAKFKVLKF